MAEYKWMLVYSRVWTNIQHPFIHLSGERRNESKLPYPRRKNKWPDQAWTWNVRSWVRHTNNKATPSPKNRKHETLLIRKLGDLEAIKWGAHTCSTEYTASLGATRSLISASFSANNFLSSVQTIELTGVPRVRTPYFSSTPLDCSWMPQFRAVWPPNDSKIPSGCSLWMT